MLSSGNHDSAIRLGFASGLLERAGLHIRHATWRRIGSPGAGRRHRDLPPPLPRAVHRGRPARRRRAHPCRGAAGRDGAGPRRPRTRPARPLGGHGPRVRHRRRHQRLRARHHASAASARSTPASSTASTTSRWATCTGRSSSARRSATPAPPCALSFSEARHTKGSWLVDLSEAAPASPRARRGAGDAARCAVLRGDARRPAGATRRHAARSRPGARSPSPTRYARWARWSGSGSASRTRWCCSSSRGAGRSRVSSYAARVARVATTSTCAATSSPTCAPVPGADRASGPLFAEAVEGSPVSGRSAGEDEGEAARAARRAPRRASREAAPARRSRRSGRSPAPGRSTSTSVGRHRAVPHPRRHRGRQDQPARRRLLRPVCRGARRACRGRPVAAQRPRPPPARSPRCGWSSPPRGGGSAIDPLAGVPAAEEARRRHHQATRPRWCSRSRCAASGCGVTTRDDEAAQSSTEVLGMGLEQFSKVVLLPQGEFAAFLRASPEERREVLERLFDTQRFTGIEHWLADRRRAAVRRRGRRPRRARGGARAGAGRPRRPPRDGSGAGGAAADGDARGGAPSPPPRRATSATTSGGRTSVTTS